MEDHNEATADVARIAGELNEQITLNNELLTQIAELEQQQLNFQADQYHREEDLRAAIRARDHALNQCDQLKRQVGVSEDAAQRAGEALRAAQLDADVKGREIDGLRKFVDETRDEIRDLQENNERLDEANATLTQELERERAKNERLSQSEGERMQHHQEAFEKQSHELAELRSMRSKLESELHQATTKLNEFKKGSAQMEKEIKEERTRAEHFSLRASKLEAEANRAVSLEAQIKSDFQNEQLRAERVEQQVAQAREIADAREVELHVCQKKLAEMVDERRHFEAEQRALKAELEGVGSELLAQAHNHDQEKQRLENRLADLTDEVTSLRDELKRSEQAHVDEKRKSGEARNRQLGETDTRLTKLQGEYQELSALLQRQRNESIAREDVVKRQRLELESKLSAATAELKVVEDRLAQRELDARKEASAMLGDIQAVNRELRDRTRSHARCMGVLEGALAQLRGSFRELQDDYGMVVTELNTLRRDAAEGASIGANMLVEWHSETHTAMLDLVSRERKAQAWLEEARSAHLSLEVQRDQGNNKLAHAEEEIARLQESLGELEKKAHFSEKQAAEKVRHVLAESDSAQSVRGELDDRVRIITRQLEAANKQNRTLQQDTERLKSAMAEADEQASKRVSGLEKQMADLERKLREAIVERDTIEAEVKMVKSALGDAKDKYVEQETLLRQAEIDRRDANERARKAHDAHKLRLELVNEQVSKYQTQLSLTKKRLAIMEDQKKVLAAEAARLREDLSSQRMSATPPAAPKALANAEGKSQEAVE